MSVRVKICGITSVRDAEAVQSEGADAIGLVLYEKSPRYVDLPQAGEIRSVIGPFSKSVALLVNPEKGFVQRVIDELKPDLLQFHGDETADFCEQFDFPYIRAIRMHKDLDIAATTRAYDSARGFLFDAWNSRSYGGTGECFNWKRLPVEPDFPLILAGGLTPDNAAEAASMVKPYALDVSSGVESSPGVKDLGKVRAFISAAKHSADK